VQAQDLAALLPEVCRLAEAAGQAILPFYRQKSLPIQLKADASPLTEADLAAHHLILQGLQELTPGIPLLSEESGGIPYARAARWERHFWLVDPLDGTREFIGAQRPVHGQHCPRRGGDPHPGSSSTPQLSASPTKLPKSWGPARGERTPSCVHDSPSALPLRPRTPCRWWPAAPTATRRRSSSSSGCGSRYGSLEVQPVGSALKFCLVAEGSAHLYPRFGPTMEWDTAAAQCLVEQAGGSVTDLAGDPLRYNKPDLHNPPFVAAAEGMAQLWQNLIP
jgi:3'(2'), 5'-bisphosphate nucleotidase